jgi:DNA-binding response OmpR family regulator
VDKLGSCEDCTVYGEHIESFEDEGSDVDHQRTILLADDEMLIRWSMYQTLRKAGYLVTLAKDGDEVQGIIQDEKFDLYVLDLRMPGCDVFSICEEIFERSIHSKIMLMTAYGSEIIQKRASDMGITYIQKPIDMTQVLEMLN